MVHPHERKVEEDIGNPRGRKEKEKGGSGGSKVIIEMRLHVPFLSSIPSSTSLSPL
jgi:hypothetical protein